MSRKTICTRSAIALIALLALTLTGLSALAAVRTDTDYEARDALCHYVYISVWDGGEKSGSGVLGDCSYTEAHTFEDGRCIYCGYSIASAQTPESDGDASDTPRAAKPAFVAASGAILTQGVPAAQALKQVFAAIPADTEVTVVGVPEDVAARLLDAINGNATAAALLAVLANFPVQTVDGVECYVVTLAYGGATESYAFSTADGALVQVF